MRVICAWCNAVIAEPGEEEGTSLGICETCVEEQGLSLDDGPASDPLAPAVTDEGLEQGPSGLPPAPKTGSGRKTLVPGQMAEEVAAEERPHLTMALMGDVMLGRGVNDTIGERGFAYPWGNVLPTLRQAGLRLINLECSITSHTREWRDGGYKTFYFRADPASITTLTAADVDFVSLANNHAGDFGAEGLAETLALLDRAGIVHGGAGANLAAARAPAMFEKGGLRVAVVSFADHPRAWAAGGLTPGINFTPVSLDAAVLRRVDNTIADARRSADLLVFSIHWGPNMRERPTNAFRDFARHVVDAGADVFWGHSAHVVQGIETWHGKLVLYDTGDFVDDYMVDPVLRNDLSGIFLVQCSGSGVESLRVVPTVICDNQARLATGAERRWLLDRVAALSRELGTEAVIDQGVLRIDVGAGQRTAAQTLPASKSARHLG